MRLSRFLSMAGITSRRKAELLIQTGVVRVNEVIITQLGTLVDETKDVITVNGKKVTLPELKVYFLLNKPIGYTTTQYDRYAEHTVFELVPKIPGLHTVGRLDRDSSGLLVLTNDGDLTYRLTHPSFEVEKEYLVVINRTIDQKSIEHLETGVFVEGKKTAPAKIRCIKQDELLMTIHEGRKRQVRKMIDAVGYRVRRLKRVRVQNLSLGDLKEGTYRSLSNNEIKGLMT